MSETLKSPVRVGIIGCGQIAQHHMRNYAKMPDVRMVAACDIIEERAAKAQQDFNIPCRHVKFRELLARDDIDAVDVCLHNNLHAPVTIAALKAGKHVYCEKPMAGSYCDALAMFKTAQRCKRRLHIQLGTLYANETQAARELIEAGELGEVYYARVTGFRRRGRPYVDGYGSENFVRKSVAGGGALYDMGVYHIAQMLYLLGNPAPVRITGKTFQKLDMDAARRKFSGYSVEEMAVGFVRFEGDLTMDVIEAWAVNLDSFEGSFLVGDRAGVRLNPFGFFRAYGHLDVSGSANMDAARYRWNNVRGDGIYYSDSQQHWISALLGRCELLPTAAIALNTMLISEGIYMAAQRNCEIAAGEVQRSSKSTALPV